MTGNAIGVVSGNQQGRIESPGGGESATVKRWEDEKKSDRANHRRQCGPSLPSKRGKIKVLPRFDGREKGRESGSRFIPVSSVLEVF